MTYEEWKKGVRAARIEDIQNQLTKRLEQRFAGVGK